MTGSVPSTMVLLTRLAKVVYRRSSEELLGMRLRQFIALSYLREKPGAPQQELGEMLHIDANNLVLLLNELESAGWVERRRDPHDRRRHVVELTPAGEEAQSRAEAAQEGLEAKVLGALSADERTMLRQLLARALESATAEPPVAKAS
jgi:DNA-binding MarR family transcriptional regulator